MYRNRSVVEYVTKRCALKNNMINAGCSDHPHVEEKINMRFILNGLKEDPEWAPFRSAYKMFKKIKELEDIDELEDWMPMMSVNAGPRKRKKKRGVGYSLLIGVVGAGTVGKKNRRTSNNNDRHHRQGNQHANRNRWRKHVRTKLESTETGGMGRTTKSARSTVHV